MSDAWGEESQLNQVGTAVVVIPAILAALVLWGVVPVEISPALLFVVVAVFGLAGGAMNLLGRGPVAAGAAVGLVMALGGFGAVYLWIHGRESVRWFEVAIAFVIGAAPGFLLQFVLQRMAAQRA